MSFQNKNHNMSPNLNTESTKYPVDKNNIIITAALPYANGEIHLGHIASTYLPADIFARYCRLVGKNVCYVCGTDDYGTPVLVKAERENKSPTDYVEYWNRKDHEDFRSIGISFDFFSKTSSSENVKFVQYVFNELHKDGLIYDRNVTQFYCEYDRKFLPDRYVKGRCPVCGAENQYSDLCEKCGSIPNEILDPRCSICERKPIKKNSQHYFFRLSFFSQELKEWLQDNNNLSGEVKKYVLNWIDKGLQDWDITRDLSWGIPIPLPDAEGKVFYGWFDNHLCYISSFATFMKQQHAGIEDSRRAWNESRIYHFIGKDIVYHHFLFLPAVRMGINRKYKLPDYMPTRGHLLLYNKKISKSRNWYIGLSDFLTRNNPDYLRFYLALVTPNSQADTNFDWDDFADRVNNDLIDNVGNFVNRSLSFISKAYDGKVPVPGQYNSIDDGGIAEINNISHQTGEFLQKNEADRGLKRILEFSKYFNQYFQRKQPWKSQGIAEGRGTISRNNAGDVSADTSATTLFISVNAVASLAILLEPFIPFSSEKIWGQLGMGMSSDVHKLQWELASKLNMKPGHSIANIRPIFHKIDAKEIAVEKARFMK